MDGLCPHFTMRTFFSVLLLIVLQTSTEAQSICSVPESVNFAENNMVDDTVATITLQPNVTVNFKPPPANPNNPFKLDGNQLIAARVLDFETAETHVVELTCTATTGLTLNVIIIVIVTNENDNPPVFAQSAYSINVDELSPVDKSVGRFTATDLDGTPLYYNLTSELNAFKLRSATNPDILVKTPLDYDKVKNVQLMLYAQDTPLESPSPGPSFTASATIMVTILDVDTRPPWFQPCTEHEVGGALICQNSGYTGRVNLNEQEIGALPLKPGPLYAIDGDSGINEEITYSFLNGDAGGLFQINPNTGNISMLKPADVLETISLTVLAAQKKNSYQFASTPVTISVQVKSLHPPRFQRSQYEGVVTAVGEMAVDPKNKDEPLKILATDDDYVVTGGLNPYISYDIIGSSDFSIIDGYLFMTKDLPEETLSLQVVAKDMTNDDSVTAQLSVEVKSVIIPSGGYGPTDMAVLGATLGVLLFICLVVIGVLIFNIRRGKADWRKIYETSMFRSSLGQGSGGQKEGIQYTNDAFQKDEDGDSTGSGGPEGGSVMAVGEPQKAAGNFTPFEAVMTSSVPLHALLNDNTSQAGSDKADSEKEVKPILTKERRMDEGYKSVWFKEDIDPDAKEEVVIIPDSRESDSEEEDEEQPSSSKEEDEDDNPQKKTQRVIFNDADMDSGLGVKMEDPEGDSDGDEMLTADL
ncbi:cadherin-related family member 5 isoform X2 [Dicentrarchus labrax]|uniref:cadherin-related family member 5 isoform X2 n=1 Tax=Dicentrarchus labrax TaxID=13489 RepID=UPI0021F57FF1|nr:cadherin-related family member 5 isoform X2 [Dicentrarchus labrax]